MTIDYDFDDKTFEYETDLDDWINSLDKEEAYDTMSSMFVSNPEYYNYFNLSEEEFNSITSEDEKEVKEILNMMKEKDLFNSYKDNIIDYFYDDAYDKYKSYDSTYMY